MIAEILKNEIDTSKSVSLREFCRYFLNLVEKDEIPELIKDYKETPAWQQVMAVAKEYSTLQELKDVKIRTSLKRSYKPEDNSDPTYNQESILRDLRPLKICAQNLKCFPPATSPKNLIYGVETAGGSQASYPVSAVFLGGNGVGKSSLFMAYELAALPQSATLRRRGYDTKAAQRSVLDYRGQNSVKFNDKDSWRSVLIHKEGILRSNNASLNNSLALWPAFFYDDLDSHFLGLNDLGLEFLSEQLGLYEVSSLINVLREIVKVLDKVSDIKTIGTGIKPWIVGNTGVKGDPMGEDGDNPNPSQRQMITRFNALHTIKYSDYRHYLPGRQVIRELLDILDARYNEALRQFDAIARPIFEALFESHLAHNDSSGGEGVGQRAEGDFKLDEKIVVDFTQSPPKVVIKVNDGDEMKPRAYFNTFRFKLYVVTLKIALACAAMRLRKVVFPIVLDDVFDSSDFHHRHDIREFMYRLTQAYSQLPESEKYPFQLILFTQDEIIGDSAWRGLVQGLGGDNVKYSRLFHYSEATDSDKSKITIEGKDYTFVSLESRIR